MTSAHSECWKQSRSKSSFLSYWVRRELDDEQLGQHLKQSPTHIRQIALSNRTQNFPAIADLIMSVLTAHDFLTKFPASHFSRWPAPLFLLPHIHMSTNCQTKDCTTLAKAASSRGAALITNLAIKPPIASIQRLFTQLYQSPELVVLLNTIYSTRGLQSRFSAPPAPRYRLERPQSICPTPVSNCCVRSILRLWQKWVKT